MNQKLIQQLFFTAATSLGGSGVYFLKNLAQEVSELNSKMAVIVINMATSQETIKDHEGRLRVLEGK